MHLICACAPALAIVKLRMVHAAAHVDGPAMLQRQSRCLHSWREVGLSVHLGLSLYCPGSVLLVLIEGSNRVQQVDGIRERVRAPAWCR